MANEDVRIEPAEAKARIDAGEAIILDVISPQSWERTEQFVAGAIRINPQEIENRYRELPEDKQIIAYCT